MGKPGTRGKRQTHDRGKPQRLVVVFFHTNRYRGKCTLTRVLKGGKRGTQRMAPA